MFSSILLVILSTVFGFTVGVTSTNTPYLERVITDYKDVENGVPIDFRYNESHSDDGPEHFVSSPGCPKSELGIPWVYYGHNSSDRKCYLAGEKGPCDIGERLFTEPDNPEGICNCGCFALGDEFVLDFSSGTLKFCQDDVSEYVFHPEFKTCYQLYEQGPCRTDEWLVKVDKESSGSKPDAVCETRKCPSGMIPAPLGSGIQINGSNNNNNVSCVMVAYLRKSVVTLLPNECEDGTKYSDLLQKCVKYGSGLLRGIGR